MSKLDINLDTFFIIWWSKKLEEDVYSEVFCWFNWSYLPSKEKWKFGIIDVKKGDFQRAYSKFCYGCAKK